MKYMIIDQPRKEEKESKFYEIKNAAENNNLVFQVQVIISKPLTASMSISN